MHITLEKYVHICIQTPMCQQEIGKQYCQRDTGKQYIQKLTVNTF